MPALSLTGEKREGRRETTEKGFERVEESSFITLCREAEHRVAKVSSGAL